MNDFPPKSDAWFTAVRSDLDAKFARAIDSAADPQTLTRLGDARRDAFLLANLLHAGTRESFLLRSTVDRLDELTATFKRSADDSEHGNAIYFLSKSLEDLTFWVHYPSAAETTVKTSVPLKLNECEQNIVDALKEHGTLKGEALAVKAGYGYDGHLRGTLASLMKRGVIENTRGHGYHLPKSGL